MRKIFPLLAISFFFLIGCNSNEESYFTQKQECAKYLPQVKQELEETRRFTGNMIPQPVIFYSPKLDTCVAAWTQSNGNNFKAFEIMDLLLNDHIYFQGYLKDQITELHNQGLTGAEEYKAKLEELKQK